MSDAWKSYSHAPAPGTVICSGEAAPEAGAKCYNLGGFPLLLVRVEGEIRAYVNACPHQYLPLDQRGDKVISADGTVLRCTNHGAGFRADTGEGVEGLGLGSALDPVPVQVNASGDIVIA